MPMKKFGSLHELCPLIDYIFSENGLLPNWADHGIKRGFGLMVVEKTMNEFIRSVLHLLNYIAHTILTQAPLILN